MILSGFLSVVFLDPERNCYEQVQDVWASCLGRFRLGALPGLEVYKLGSATKISKMDARFCLFGLVVISYEKRSNGHELEGIVN